MAKAYEMKDLGYKRTPTAWTIRVNMDYETWDVPAQIVADSRDDHYSDDKEDTIGHILDKSLDTYELLDWARSNMNWDEVEEYSTFVSVPVEQDRQDGWVNGITEIVKPQ